jgi:hypothetical protein
MGPLKGRIGLAGTRFSPAVKLMFSSQPIPPGRHVMLNPQPLPPRMSSFRRQHTLATAPPMQHQGHPIPAVVVGPPAPL